MSPIIFLLLGCISEDDKPVKKDTDGDGILDSSDCAPNDDTIGELTWYKDSDGDGYGEGSEVVTACEAPSNEYVALLGDCDDTNPTVFSGADEICDSIDNDCNGLIDDEDTNILEEVLSTFYQDSDGDGYGDAAVSLARCEAPDGYVEDSSDCDDTSASFNRSDVDGDGYSTCDNDCDDNDAAVSPAAAEMCNNVDDDCNDLIDDAPSDGDFYYQDSDGDGYGNSAVSEYACEASSGFVSNSMDCDDTNAALNLDDADGDGYTTCENDCDDTSAALNLDDADGDGYTTCENDCDDTSATLNLDDTDGDGYSSCDNDCNDIDADIFPGQTEYCDLVDNDCDPNTTEDGVVTQELSNGTLTNLSVSTDPSTITSATASESQSLYFCDGDYYMSLDVEADVNITGLGSNVVLHSGESDSLISMTTDNVNVTIDSVSIEDSGSLSFSYGALMLFEAPTSGSLTLDYVNIENNLSLAAILNAQNLQIEINNSTFEDNNGGWIGPIRLLNSELNITDSLFENNTGVASGGMYAQESIVTVTDTDFTMANSASVIGLFDSELTISSSSIYSNELIGSAGALTADETSVITSNAIDFADPLGNDANTPYDLLVGDIPYNVDGSASFTCSAGVCGTDSTTTYGSQANQFSGSSWRVRGNVYTIDGFPTLHSFGTYFTCGGFTFCGCDIYNYVYTRPNSSSDWEEQFFEELSGVFWPNGSYRSSSDIDLALLDGEQVALVSGWECSSLEYYREDSPASGDFGEVTGYLTTVTSGVVDPTDISFTTTEANNTVYNQRVMFTEIQ